MGSVPTCSFMVHNWNKIKMDQSAVVVSAEAEDCELSEGFGAAWIVLHQTLNVISPWKLETRGSWSTETPVTPSVTSTAFFLTPHLKQTKASESAGTKRFKMCVSRRCLPTFLSESSRFLLCPWSLGSGLPAQEGRSTNSPPSWKKSNDFFCILADEQTAGSVGICWHQIINCYILCQHFSQISHHSQR